VKPDGDQNENKTADDPTQQVQALERRVEVIRGRLDGVVGELDQRWHHLWTLPPALRRYARPLLITGAALALAATGALVARTIRRRQMSGGRLRRYGNVLSQVMREPERLVQPARPSGASRILVAAGAAAASVLARHLATALVENSRRRPPRHG
jgi:malonyl CoA-acyl carrier protein transacylase